MHNFLIPGDVGASIWVACGDAGPTCFKHGRVRVSFLVFAWENTVWDHFKICQYYFSVGKYMKIPIWHLTYLFLVWNLEFFEHMETRKETCRMEIRILSNMRFGSCWKMHLEDVVLQMDRHSLAESRLGSSARTIRCSIYRSQIKSVSRHKHPLERERDIYSWSAIFSFNIRSLQSLKQQIQGAARTWKSDAQASRGRTARSVSPARRLVATWAQPPEVGLHWRRLWFYTGLRASNSSLEVYIS